MPDLGKDQQTILFCADTSAMITFIQLLFILPYLLSEGVVIVDQDRLTFQRFDQSLPWPLPDNTDPGILTLHGAHCLEHLQHGSTSSQNVTIMHREHCRNVIDQILNFFQRNPSNRVADWICQAIQPDRRARSPDHFSCYINQCNDGENSTYSNIGKQIREEVWRNVASQGRGVGGNQTHKWFNCYSGSCLGREKRNVGRMVRGRQDDVLANMAAFNMGQLLMKNWTEPMSLNFEEQKYVERWESRPAIAMGAIGVFCRVKGNLDDLRAILTENS